MIKAEVITHEGTPAPNWLDRCRTLVSPGKISAVILVAASFALVLAVTQRGGNVEEPTPSQQANTSAVESLQVQPLQPTAGTTADGMPTLQPTATNSIEAQPTTSNQPGGDAAANAALGAQSTPELNKATTPSAATNKSKGRSQQNLTNNIQSTLQSLNQSLERTRETVRDTLKGNPLGL